MDWLTWYNALVKPTWTPAPATFGSGWLNIITQSRRTWVDAMHNFLFTLVATVFLLSSAVAQEKELPKPVQLTLNWTTPAIQADRVQYLTFDSAAASSKVSYHIYTPEAYDQAKDRRFPVLYWLHGTGGGLPGIKRLSQFFDEAIRMEKIPPMLVVFPNGLATSMWCDSKDGRVPMETVVVKELVPHVDKTFRTLANRGGRIIEGFSMGGYGAGRLGFLYPDTFGTTSVLAGGPMDLEFQGPRARRNPAEREQILKGTFGDDLDYFKNQSPLTIAEKHADSVRGKSKIRVVVGELDFSLELNRDYSEHLRTLKIDHEMTVVPGVAHETMPLLNGLGDANWQFYRAAFGKK